MNRSVCLLNDSFPPLIDGVANTVYNYASQLHGSYGNVTVITPELPEADDSHFPFPVVRCPAIDTRKLVGYMAGMPLMPREVQTFSRQNVDLIHSHCPVVSNLIARELRNVVHAPIVFTYHTKFDIDIQKVIRGKLLQDGAIHAMVQNISACDEVWVVSRGAGENLRALGYQGDYIVMPNGVDVPKERIDEETIFGVTKDYDLPQNVPCFLFVGRMMWYKGIRITLDALAKLHRDQTDFRMVFIGDGVDRKEIEQYAKDSGIDAKCLFLGAIHDRKIIRTFYSRADLFLFPSTFDTNGLVVREAAACGLGSVLVRGSCAAEDVQENENCFLIEENADSMYAVLKEAVSHMEFCRRIGKNAMDQLYLSWHDSIEHAKDRYEIVIDRYKSGLYHPKEDMVDDFFTYQAQLIEVFNNFNALRAENRFRIQSRLQYVDSAIKDKRQETKERLLETYRKYHKEIKDLEKEISDFFDLYL